MRVGSLFSGVGGFDLGLELAGHEIVWQVENDKQCRSVLRHHWPNVDLYEDVKDVGRTTKPDTTERPTGPDCVIRKAGSNIGGVFGGHGDAADERQRTTLAPVDLICGGFPCQDYSVAGKRGGLVGDRGALWWRMHRIVAQCRPTWVVGENVPGLVSSNGGCDFLTIIASLVELGYGVTWATLDSQYFGVAQRRRRLFIVGHSGGVPRPEILALSEGLHGHPAPSKEAGQEVAACLGTRSASGHDERGEVALVETYHGTSATLTKSASGVARTGFNGEEEFVVGAVPRRLTPTECERLQGFPDDWTQWGVDEDGERVELADGPRYRMMGNAVTVSVAEWIGRRLPSEEE